MIGCSHPFPSTLVFLILQQFQCAGFLTLAGKGHKFQFVYYQVQATFFLTRNKIVLLSNNCGIS